MKKSANRLKNSMIWFFLFSLILLFYHLGFTFIFIMLIITSIISSMFIVRAFIYDYKTFKKLKQDLNFKKLYEEDKKRIKREQEIFKTRYTTREEKGFNYNNYECEWEKQRRRIENEMLKAMFYNTFKNESAHDYTNSYNKTGHYTIFSPYDISARQILGVSQTATDEEIKRAFRKMALKTHPDTGGDTKEFQKVNWAYQVLTKGVIK